MRSLCLLLLSAFALCAQPFSFGVKGGIPLTDFQDTFLSSNPLNFHTNTSRYIIGPTAELRLPFGFGIEVDALYRHLSYTSNGNLLDTITNSKTTGNAWEFPLLAKYRFHSEVVRPYVDAGIAWDTLQGLTQTVRNTVVGSNLTTTTSTSNPAELHNTTTTGFVIGAGIDVHVLIHISPEIRYTRWGAEHFLSSNGGLRSNQNQAEFLLGITF